jgi:tetratricopeptide (TPR) repeat protein
MDRMRTIWQSESRRTWLVAAGLAVVTVAVFAPAFDCGWVNYDDHEYVTENPDVTGGLTADNVARAFTTFRNANWHPLTWLSLQLDATLWRTSDGGPDARGFHLTNVLVHAANAALVFLSLRALTGAFWRSAPVALLFAIHPLRAESVAWVSERKDVLSVFFGLLSLWAYAVYVRRRSWRLYLAMAVALVASLMCKPMLVTLPFLLLVLDWWPLGREGVARYQHESVDAPEPRPLPALPNGTAKLPKAKNMRRALARANPVAVGAGAREPLAQATPEPSSAGAPLASPALGLAEAWRRLAVEKLPLFALVAASAVVTYQAQAAGGAVGDLRKFPLAVRLENAPVSYVDYLYKTIWPFHLSPFYEHPGDRQLLASAAGSAVLLAALTVAAVVLRKRAPYLLAGWLWFLGTLVPVIGIVQVGMQAMADRYTYIPQIGILIALCWGASDLVRGHARVMVLSIVTTAAGLALAVLTFRQVGTWHDSVTLWENAIVATGGNAEQMLNLGGACEDQGYWADATKWYEDILRRSDIHKTNFEVVQALTNLGNLRSEQGDQESALQLLDEALKQDPNRALAHTTRGTILYRLKRFQEAAAEHEVALKLQPELKGAAYNLGLACAALGDNARAAESFRQALHLKPDFAEAHSMLGNAQLKLGKTEDGLQHLRDAIRYDPDYVDGHINLGKGLASRGELDQAARQFEQALQAADKDKRPEHAKRVKASRAMAWANLGATRAPQRRAEEAVDCMLKAIENDPGEANYRNALNNYVDYLKKNDPEQFHRIEDRLRRLEELKAVPPPVNR